MRVIKLILGISCCMIWACGNEVQTAQHTTTPDVKIVPDSLTEPLSSQTPILEETLNGSYPSETFGEIQLVATRGGQNQTLRLEEVKRDGITSETFKYDAENKLTVWSRIDEYRFFYSGRQVERVEVWEDTYDGWEKIAEILPTYHNNVLMGYRRYETQEERLLESEYSLTWDNQNRIVEFSEFDFIDQKELVATTKLTYLGGMHVRATRLNSTGKLIDSTEIIYDKALNALSLSNFPLAFFDGEIVTVQQEKSRVTTKKNNTITMTWSNFSDPNGVLHKAILTIPIKGKPVEFEYIYTPDKK